MVQVYFRRHFTLWRAHARRTLPFSFHTGSVGETRRSNSTKSPMFNASIMRREGGAADFHSEARATERTRGSLIQCEQLDYQRSQCEWLGNLWCSTRTRILIISRINCLNLGLNAEDLRALGCEKCTWVGQVPKTLSATCLDWKENREYIIKSRAHWNRLPPPFCIRGNPRQAI